MSSSVSLGLNKSKRTILSIKLGSLCTDVVSHDNNSIELKYQEEVSRLKDILVGYNINCEVSCHKVKVFEPYEFDLDFSFSGIPNAIKVLKVTFDDGK